MESLDTYNYDIASDPVVGIIEKWYQKLGFDRCFDSEFYEMLHNIPVSSDVTIDNYDLKCADGKKNLLSFLYMCEALREQYLQKGISEEILVDTLRDIVRWCNVWSELDGHMSLKELSWLSHHMRGELFKLGRLQFCIERTRASFDTLGIEKGETVIGVHIPKDGPLDIDACRDSFKMAKSFFAKYFPDVHYRYFSCHSWLLDDSLKEILPETSNIIRFGDMFHKVYAEKSEAITYYVFRWLIKPNEIEDFVCTSRFAQTVKERYLAGMEFHDTQGFIENI